MAIAFGVATVLTLYHNLLILLPIPTVLHTPANLATTAFFVRVSRTRGLSDEQLGLARTAVAPGIQWGAAVSSAIAAAVATTFAISKGSSLFRDERIARLSAPRLIHRLIVHIPLGTAVSEEILFRGVLYGLWARAKGQRYAVVASSAAFGLWHVGPAIHRLRTNRPYATDQERMMAVTGTIAVTALGGMLLSFLRIRSKGVVAPIIVHWATNAFGTVAARMAMEGNR